MKRPCVAAVGAHWSWGYWRVWLAQVVSVGDSSTAPGKLLGIPSCKLNQNKELECCRKCLAAIGVLSLLGTGRRNRPMRVMGKLILMGFLAAAACTNARAQQQKPQQPGDNRPPVISLDTIGGSADQATPNEADKRRSAPAPGQPADGSRHGLPVETFAVVTGTRVLVRLEDELNTGECKTNYKFKVRTMEPLEAGSGFYLPAGAEIRGHVSKVEPAGITGRAKLYLVFDEIKTRFGILPIVADVVSVPGDHSVKIGSGAEGVIEGKKSTQQAAGEAAAEGAGMGAVRGIKDKNAKEAVERAAEAALDAYLMESGRGHEIDLPKGAKLELELERALYLVRE